METRRKKKKSNLIMVVLIAVIAFCGIMAVGTLKGWFGGSDSPMAVEDITGTANIERSGVGYSLEKGTALQAGDIVETRGGSEASLAMNKDNAIELNENTEIVIDSCETDYVRVTLNQGEIFLDVSKAPKSLEVTFGKNTAKVTGTVFSVSAQAGSSTLNVYEGSVEVIAEDGSESVVDVGSCISVINSSAGDLTVEISKLKAAALSNFVIDKMQNADSKSALCFSEKELKKVAEERTKESADLSNGSTDMITTAEGSSDSASQAKAAGKCTITIRCNTILKNMDDLTPGKGKYVPSNGVILATSTVEFAKGETVFDVLQRACSYAGIHLEYSWTPMYDSYYIEGINHLYEFDCGSESGWMYKVNGWFPNYGCSSYTLNDGDSIVWDYTCNGLGADVGGNVR